MERFTQKVVSIETGKVLAYLLKGDADRLKANRKLGELEDLEEQGLLLRLEVKPGDKLYWISDPDDDVYDYDPIEEVEVCNIDYNGYSIQLWFADRGEKEFPVLPSVAMGNELFATYEEAEAALAKMKGE